MLNNLKKEIYISLGIADDAKIKNCLKRLSLVPKKKIYLIYTSLSYDPNDLNLNRIKYLKKKFKLKVGYGHHYINILPLLFSGIFDYDFIFTYIKSKKILPLIRVLCIHHCYVQIYFQFTKKNSTNPKNLTFRNFLKN